MAAYMGRAMAEVMDGHPEANPMREWGPEERRVWTEAVL
jgi:hypothetical protein